MGTVPNTRIASQITIGSDLAALADGHIALDHHPGENPAPLAQMQYTMHIS